MSTTVCLYNYEYNGQVLSPAFSDPPSPKEYDNNSDEDGYEVALDLSPPVSPRQHISSKTSNSISSHTPSAKDLWKNKLKRKTSDFETTSGCCNNTKDGTDKFLFVNKKPRFPTKYHEMLQPLSPVTTFPPVNTTDLTSLNMNQKPKTDVQLQERFNALIDESINQINDDLSSNEGSSTNKVEDFLSKHSEFVDLNRYNCEGQTPLQRCCLEGNLSLAKLLVQHGAKSKITTRDGFSTLHIAAFSGHSQVLFFILNLSS